MVFAFDGFINTYKRTSATLFLEKELTFNFFLREGGGGGGGRGSKYNSYNTLTRPLHGPVLSIFSIIAPDQTYRWCLNLKFCDSKIKQTKGTALIYRFNFSMRRIKYYSYNILTPPPHSPIHPQHIKKYSW